MAGMNDDRQDLLELAAIHALAHNLFAFVCGNVEALSDPARRTMPATQEADEPIILGQRIERAGAP